MELARTISDGGDGRDGRKRVVGRVEHDDFGLRIADFRFPDFKFPISRFQISAQTEQFDRKKAQKTQKTSTKTRRKGARERRGPNWKRGKRNQAPPEGETTNGLKRG
jgi:hypothetical protein